VVELALSNHSRAAVSVTLRWETRFRLRLGWPLPLNFCRGPATCIGAPRLEGQGEALSSNLPWSPAPPLDDNPARLRDGAIRWATAADGSPMAAHWNVGKGQVVAIALECFGNGHGTLVHWPGQRPRLRRALDWLTAPRAPASA
jgi:hypothetical protein